MNTVMVTSDDRTSAQHRLLCAGPLTMRFDGGDLRYIKLGDREIIRRIYVAVRDRNWGTVPSEISNLKSEIAETSYRIRYTSTHRQCNIHFEWQAEIVGAADGSIRFTFDGEAKSTFLRNRIGFCVLHPIRECVGAKCRARYTNGREKELVFPDTIAAEQPVTNLHDLAGLSHEIEPGVWAELEFEGDVFEMEDQRNWIDASFKTFCTPLRMPFPVKVKQGTRVKQEVRLKLLGVGPKQQDRVGRVPTPSMTRGESAISSFDSTVVTITAQEESRRLPAVGLVSSLESGVTDEHSLRRLQALHLTHLRVDVRASDAESSVHLTGQSSDAEVLGHQIEPAIHLDDLADWSSPDAYLEALANQLRIAQTPLARILVFGLGVEHCSSVEGLRLARKHLGVLGIPIGGGTNADLYQLNLQRPPTDVDFICWSMNPQVHAFDNASIAETPEAATQQIASVRTYFPGKPLVVSPVTLKPRFNPVATGVEPAVPPGELPPQVDPRQLSLFAAAWTLAMIKALAESGIDSVTFYETTGWRGVMETEAGSTLPAKFPSIAGAVFPLYHVLADVGEFAGGEVWRTEYSDLLSVASLCLQAGQRRRLMLANLSAEPRRMSLKYFDGIARARILDASTRLTAMTSPEEFRAGSSPFHGAELELAPYALATLDFADLGSAANQPMLKSCTDL